MTSLPTPPEDPTDQHFISVEFQRANTLMAQLSDRQHKFSLKKLGLERKILSRGGVDDAELWTELNKCRV